MKYDSKIPTDPTSAALRSRSLDAQVAEQYAAASVRWLVLTTAVVAPAAAVYARTVAVSLHKHK
jgi:hypothetical protein